MDTIQQLRSHRVYNIAMFDLVGSIVGVGWLNQRFGTGSFMHGALAAIPLGIVAHYAWGVPTELNYKLGLSEPPVREPEREAFREPQPVTV